jgi:hypothetical protein
MIRKRAGPCASTSYAALVEIITAPSQDAVGLYRLPHKQRRGDLGFAPRTTLLICCDRSRGEVTVQGLLQDLSLALVDCSVLYVSICGVRVTLSLIRMEDLFDILEPVPDIFALYMLYNELYFNNSLGACSVHWSSSRMTL